MTLNKRQFFRLMAGAALVAGTGVSSAAIASPRLDKSAIVIGAGMAGIKAAQDLLKAGLKVTVLEGRDRIGGRTFTDSLGGVPIDMGASWIHGSGNNPLYDYARARRAPTVPWDYEDANIYSDEGLVTKNLDAQFDAFESAMELYGMRKMFTDPDASVQDLIDAAQRSGRLDGMSKSELNMLISSGIEESFAMDADRLSLRGLMEGEDFTGPDMLLPNGYGTLVATQATGLDIHTAQKVTHVDYSGKRVTVETETTRYDADYVVITVPLGVLKSGAISFTPALPRRHTRAVENLDMGVMNKLYLRFPSVFWDKHVSNFARMSEVRGAWGGWVNMCKLSGKPVLCAFNVGRFGQALESLTDEAIVGQALDVLGKMFGRTIPSPTAYKISRWARDPFAFGSYSFMPTSGKPSMRKDLAKPIDKKLYFAGEATHSDFPATVQGAYWSGEKAARSIAKRARR